MIRLENFIFSAKAPAVFAYIPKVACTNWKCILRYLDGHHDYLNSRLAHDRKKSNLKYLSEYSNPYDLINDTSIKKITCVRNPYSRILSAYLNKVKPFSSPEAIPEWDPYFFKLYKEINEFRLKNTSNYEDVTFDCFLDWILFSNNIAVKDEHWIPQTDLIGEGEVDFYFICHFEKFKTELPIALEILKCDIPFPSQSEVNFLPTNANSQLDIFYLPESIQKVRSIYQKDFLRLNYDIQPFWLS